MPSLEETIAEALARRDAASERPRLDQLIETALARRAGQPPPERPPQQAVEFEPKYSLPERAALGAAQGAQQVGLPALERAATYPRDLFAGIAQREAPGSAGRSVADALSFGFGVPPGLVEFPLDIGRRVGPQLDPQGVAQELGAGVAGRVQAPRSLAQQAEAAGVKPTGWEEIAVRPFGQAGVLAAQPFTEDPAVMAAGAEAEAAAMERPFSFGAEPAMAAAPLAGLPVGIARIPGRIGAAAASELAGGGLAGLRRGAAEMGEAMAPRFQEAPTRPMPAAIPEEPIPPPMEPPPVPLPPVEPVNVAPPPMAPPPRPARVPRPPKAAPVVRGAGPVGAAFENYLNAKEGAAKVRAWADFKAAAEAQRAAEEQRGGGAPPASPEPPPALPVPFEAPPAPPVPEPPPAPLPPYEPVRVAPPEPAPPAQAVPPEAPPMPRRPTPPARPVEAPPPAPRQPQGARAPMHGARSFPDIEGRWELVELDDIIASHDTNLNPNPRFPKEAQPRDFNEVARKLRLSETTKGFKPERVMEAPELQSGGPTLDRNSNVAEVGNGRVIAMRRNRDGTHGGDPARWRKYQDDLQERAAAMGLDPAGMRDPVLVRRRTTELTPEQRARFVKEANEDIAQGMGGAARAKAEAGNIPDALMAEMDVSPVSSAVNREWAGRVAREMTNDTSSMMTGDGRLTAEGALRVEQAVLTKVYGEKVARLVAERTEGDNVSRVVSALVEGAPILARIQKRVRGGSWPAALDIAKDLAAAAEKVASLKRGGIKVEEYLKPALLEDTSITPFQRELIRDLGSIRSEKAAAAAFRDFERTVTSEVPHGGQRALSALEKEKIPSGADLWRRARAKGRLFKGLSGTAIPKAPHVGEEWMSANDRAKAEAAAKADLFGRPMARPKKGERGALEVSPGGGAAGAFLGSLPGAYLGDPALAAAGAVVGGVIGATPLRAPLVGAYRAAVRATEAANRVLGEKGIQAGLKYGYKKMAPEEFQRRMEKFLNAGRTLDSKEAFDLFENMEGAARLAAEDVRTGINDAIRGAIDEQAKTQGVKLTDAQRKAAMRDLGQQIIDVSDRASTRTASDLAQDIYHSIRPLHEKLRELGRDVKDLEMLSEETFERSWADPERGYYPHLYESRLAIEYLREFGRAGIPKPSEAARGRLKKRKLDYEEAVAAGLQQDPALLISTGIAHLSNLKNVRLLQERLAAGDQTIPIAKDAAVVRRYDALKEALADRGTSVEAEEAGLAAREANPAIVKMLEDQRPEYEAAKQRMAEAEQEAIRRGWISTRLKGHGKAGEVSKLPDDKWYGPLRGAYVDPDLVGEISDLAGIGRDGFLGALLAGQSAWKIGKLANPKTIIRNVMGEFVKGDIESYPALEQPFWWGRAISEMRSKSAAYKEAVESGAVQSTWMSAEDIAVMQELEMGLSRATQLGARSGVGRLSMALSQAPRLLKVGAKVYNAVEQSIRLGHYLYARDILKMSAKDAARRVNRAHFNYRDMPRVAKQASRFIHPFAGFAYKFATWLPDVATRKPLTALKWAAYIAAADALGDAISGGHDFGEALLGPRARERRIERAGRPWQERLFSVRLPYKSENELPMDLQALRILPVLVQHSLMGVDFAGPPTPLDIADPTAPLLTMPIEMSRNVGLYRGKQIAGPEDDPMAAVGEHLYRFYQTASPGLVQEVEANVKAAMGVPYRGQPQNFFAAFARRMVGVYELVDWDGMEGAERKFDVRTRAIDTELNRSLEEPSAMDAFIDPMSSWERKSDAVFQEYDASMSGFPGPPSWMPETPPPRPYKGRVPLTKMRVKVPAR